MYVSIARHGVTKQLSLDLDLKMRIFLKVKTSVALNLADYIKQFWLSPGLNIKSIWEWA